MSFGVSVGDVLKLCEIAGRVYKNCRRIGYEVIEQTNNHQAGTVPVNTSRSLAKRGHCRIFAKT